MDVCAENDMFSEETLILKCTHFSLVTVQGHNILIFLSLKRL